MKFWASSADSPTTKLNVSLSILSHPHIAWSVEKKKHSMVIWSRKINMSSRCSSCFSQQSCWVLINLPAADRVAICAQETNCWQFHRAKLIQQLNISAVNLSEGKWFFWIYWIVWNATSLMQCNASNTHCVWVNYGSIAKYGNMAGCCCPFEKSPLLVKSV